MDKRKHPIWGTWASGLIGYLGRLLNDAERSRLHRCHSMMPQTEGSRHIQAYTLAITL
jgi:hypothetical protein